MWFTSSRWPIDNKGVKATDKQSHIYYIDRNVKGALCPNQGWDTSSTGLKILRTGDKEFDVVAKGAVSIGGNVMIVSADGISDSGNNYSNEYHNLYSLTQTNTSSAPFNNPKVIKTLSNFKTWESQPTISRDGGYMFFVSNRKVLDYNSNDKYSNDTTDGEKTNIYFSYFDTALNSWATPILVKELCKENFCEETPQISADGKILYYSTNQDGNFNFYSVPIKLSGNTYQILDEPKEVVIEDGKGGIAFKINTEADERYIYHYYNPKNEMEEALVWASNRTEGWGNYDIYGCGITHLATYRVYFKTQNDGELITTETPVASLFDSEGTLIETKEMTDKNYIEFNLIKGKRYYAKGGVKKTKYDYIDDSTTCVKWYPAIWDVQKNVLIDQKANIDTTIETIPWTEKARTELLKKINSGSITNNTSVDTSYLGKARTKKTTTEVKYLKYEADVQSNLLNAYIETKMTEEVFGVYTTGCNSDAKADLSDGLVTSATVLTKLSINNHPILKIPSKLDQGIMITDTVYLIPSCNTSKINLVVKLINKCPAGEKGLENPYITISGAKNETVSNVDYTTTLALGKEYKIFGGANANIYNCDLNSKYICTGYQEWKEDDPDCNYDIQRGDAKDVSSIPGIINTDFNGLNKDTTIYAYIYITKNI